VQSFGIGVAQFELDMLTVALDCFAADAELFRDLTRAVSSRDEREHGHLAIAENIKTVRKVATTGQLSHREEVIARLA
jgi:hypothetical protein